MEKSTIENMMMSSSTTPYFSADDFKNMMKPEDMIQMIKVQLNIMESSYENIRKHIN